MDVRVRYVQGRVGTQLLQAFHNIGFTESYGYFYAMCFHQTQMMCKFQVTLSRQDQLNSGWI